MRTIFGAFDQTGGQPQKVYVIGTHYDMLNEPKEDWAKQKTEWSRYLTSKDTKIKNRSCYTKELAEKNIIATSAYIALLCELYKQGKLDEDRKFYLYSLSLRLFKDANLEANLENLLNFANVNTIYKRISEDILDKVQEYFISGVRANYENLKASIMEYFTQDISKENEAYNALSLGLDEINKQIEEQKRELEEAKAKENELKKGIREFNGNVETLNKELQAQIRQMIRGV